METILHRNEKNARGDDLSGDGRLRFIFRIIISHSVFECIPGIVGYINKSCIMFMQANFEENKYHYHHRRYIVIDTMMDGTFVYDIL